MFNYKIDGINKYIDFGTYALANYYAKQVDSVKGKKLIEATFSEWKYRVENDLPENGLDGLEDFDAHFVPSDIQEVISFIENDVIPALNSETQNLLDKYGGRIKFYERYYANPDYLIVLGLNRDEYYDDNYGIRGFFIELKEILSYSLAHNKPYEVVVY